MIYPFPNVNVLVIAKVITHPLCHTDQLWLSQFPALLPINILKTIIDTQFVGFEQALYFLAGLRLRKRYG
jgi:hypothetical protein